MEQCRNINMWTKELKKESKHTILNFDKHRKLTISNRATSKIGMNPGAPEGWTGMIGNSCSTV